MPALVEHAGPFVRREEVPPAAVAQANRQPEATTLDRLAASAIAQ